MKETITPFDVADYLKTDQDIKLFLKEAAKTGDMSDFIHALSTASRAKGMTEVANQTGITHNP